MDHRLKYKNKNYKTSRRKHKENLCSLRLDEDFLDITPKAEFIKENNG